MGSVRADGSSLTPPPPPPARRPPDLKYILCSFHIKILVEMTCLDKPLQPVEWLSQNCSITRCFAQPVRQQSYPA